MEDGSPNVGLSSGLRRERGYEIEKINRREGFSPLSSTFSLLPLLLKNVFPLIFLLILL